ncbi:hypothetical protein EDB85DRAFT_2070861 [Lactarius pseudohatsudake]|nr:hypothetical protein EDB85DRAFT_2070861 [Lactarius pseudohatsudake]
MSLCASRGVFGVFPTRICAHKRRTLITIYRHYATHRDPPSNTHPRVDSSSLLSQALDQKQRKFRREDSVGPFQLGLSQPYVDGSSKKWSELSPKGKGQSRSFKRIIAVILFGAGLTAILAYALTSELVSRNSPTVLYEEACQRIKSSHGCVAKYLPGPLVFHNNPPSVLRPRHRNRHVSSQILTLIYPDSHTSYFQSVSSWVTDAVTNLPELSWQETKDSAMHHAQETVSSAKDLFRYLSGDPVSPQPAATHVAFPEPLKQEVPTGDRKGFWSGVAGLFGSLRNRSRTGPQEGTPEAGHGRLWHEGEVHADLVRDDSGYFVFRYILIDIPGSQSRNPLRIFVERTDGVRENEPVVRWDAR